MKRNLPLYLLFIFAVWGGISVFVGKESVHEIDNLLRNKLLLIVGAFAIILGLGSLIFHHMVKIRNKSRYWQYSYVTLVSLFISSFIGLFGGVRGEGGFPTIFGGIVLLAHDGQVYAFQDEAEMGQFKASPDKFIDPARAVMPLPSNLEAPLTRYSASVLRDEIELRAANARRNGTQFEIVSPVTGKPVPFTKDFRIHIQQLFEGILVPCGSTMFAMLAFYMCSAAYRAFRMRNLHAGVLLISAFIVMLGQIPLATAYIPGVYELRQWILDVPNMASKRGIMIGVGLGAVATSFKIIFGIERAWLGGDE